MKNSILVIFLGAIFFVSCSDNSVKFKTAVIDMSNLATAISDYITDKGTPPGVYGVFDERSDLYKKLYPNYMKNIPVKDPWGNKYFVYSGCFVNGNYGITGSEADDFLIVSYGEDGSPELGYYYPFVDLNDRLYKIKENNGKDLINLNGKFIRGPRELVAN